MNTHYLFLLCAIICLSLGKADEPGKVEKTSDSEASNEEPKHSHKLRKHENHQSIMQPAPEKCSDQEIPVKKKDVDEMLKFAQKDKETGQKPEKIEGKLNTKKPGKSETEQTEKSETEQNEVKPKNRGYGFKSLGGLTGRIGRIQPGFNLQGEASDDTQITSIAYLCQVCETRLYKKYI